MKLTKDDIVRPGPCLYPGCQKTEYLLPVREGRVPVYCYEHAAYLRTHPDADKALVR